MRSRGFGVVNEEKESTEGIFFCERTEEAKPMSSCRSQAIINKVRTC